MDINDKKYDAQAYLKFRPNVNEKNVSDITIDEFFEHSKGLYIQPQNNHNYDTIKNNLKYPNSSSIMKFITGDAGCGKSVFVSKLFHDIINNKDQKRNIYSIVHDHEDKSGINGNGSLINIVERVINRLIDSIANMICEDCYEKPHIFTRFLKYIIKPKNNIITNNIIYRYCFDFMNNNTLTPKKYFNRDLSPEQRKEELKDTFTQYIKTILKKDDSNDILEKMIALNVFDYLWRIIMYKKESENYNTTENEKYLYISYDNTDLLIDQPQILYNLITSVYCALKTIDNHNINSPIPLRIIIPVRNSTYTDIQSRIYKNMGKLYASDLIAIMEDLPIDISNEYNYTDIVKRRMEYLDERKKAGRPLSLADNGAEIVKQVYNFNKISFVKKQYRRMFSYNYRECINEFFHIKKINNASYIENIETLVQDTDDTNPNEHDDEYNTYGGASSILLSAILLDFSSFKIFSALNLIELNEDGKKRKKDTNQYENISMNKDNIFTIASIARILLTYIYNSTQAVYLNKLFEYFEEIYTPRLIINTITACMQTHGRWRRLLYAKDIDRTNYADEDSIEEILDKMCNDYENTKGTKYDLKYAIIEISEAGKTYIEIIASHFEFFSVRCYNDITKPDSQYMPLFFCNASDNKTDGEKFKFNFDPIIEKVYNSVKECIENLNTLNKIFLIEKGIKEEEYLYSQLVGTTQYGHKQTHEERIIFQHIYLIEDFRWYMLNKYKNTNGASVLREINKNLVGWIIKYLELFKLENVKVFFNPTREDIKTALTEKANAIRDSDYNISGEDINRRIVADKNQKNEET